MPLMDKLRGAVGRSFSDLERQLLEEFHVPLAEAKKYSPRFEFIDIPVLHFYNIAPEVANGFSPKIYHAKHIINYVWAGLTPDKISPDKQEKLLPVLERISAFHSSYTLVGTGAHAVVFRDNKHNRALKMGLGLDEEIRLLERIKREQEQFGGKGKENVLTLHYVSERGLVSVLILEYIHGKSLEQVLDKDEVKDSKEALSYGGVIEQGEFYFTSGSTIRYGSDIFNGLSLLRRAGIHHRDLWLGNVVIDKKKSHAVIIDFDMSTDDNSKLVYGNRRYGGENDLQSLGQIMYRMVAGHHIFNPSVHLSTHWIPDEIKAEREQVYGHKKVLEKRLRQVDKTVQDWRVADLIKRCLTADGVNPSYEPIAERFKEYDIR